MQVPSQLPTQFPSQPIMQLSLHWPEQAPSQSFRQWAVQLLWHPLSHPPEQSFAQLAVQLPEQSPVQLPSQSPLQSARAGSGTASASPNAAMTGMILLPLLRKPRRSIFFPGSGFFAIERSSPFAKECSALPTH